MAVKPAANRGAGAPQTPPDAPGDPPAPQGLSTAAAALWRAVVAEFDLERHQLEVLGAACRELTAADEADQAVAADGRFERDRYGGRKVHPGVAAGRSSRLAAARLLKLLDLEPPAGSSPPMRGRGRYRRGTDARMTPRKPAAAARRQQQHVCGPGCPGRGSPSTPEQVQESYRHHRRELEAQLARSIPTGRLRGWRPAWWWEFASEAIPYRVGPGRFEDPTDYTVSSETVPEVWMREGIKRRRVEQLGRLRFLARSGLLSDAEVRRILARGDSLEAKVVREELARKAPP